MAHSPFELLPDIRSDFGINGIAWIDMVVDDGRPLFSLGIRELNAWMRLQGLSDSQRANLKHARRTAKNRMYQREHRLRGRRP
jgi:hypothetical protein